MARLFDQGLQQGGGQGMQAHAFAVDPASALQDLQASHKVGGEGQEFLVPQLDEAARALGKQAKELGEVQDLVFIHDQLAAGLEPFAHLVDAEPQGARPGGAQAEGIAVEPLDGQGVSQQVELAEQLERVDQVGQEEAAVVPTRRVQRGQGVLCLGQGCGLDHEIAADPHRPLRRPRQDQRRTVARAQDRSVHTSGAHHELAGEPILQASQACDEGGIARGLFADVPAFVVGDRHDRGHTLQQGGQAVMRAVGDHQAPAETGSQCLLLAIEQGDLEA
ncbi:MAG: hypothetical protein GXP62_05730, partial [Oligoflexia bacterium]|nr:hypothetical protein [Oligoflexia bacterium]